MHFQLSRSDRFRNIRRYSATGSSYTNVNANSYYSQGAGNNFQDLTVRKATKTAKPKHTLVELQFLGILSFKAICFRVVLANPTRAAGTSRHMPRMASSSPIRASTSLGAVDRQNVAAKSTGNSFADLTVTGADELYWWRRNIGGQRRNDGLHHEYELDVSRPRWRRRRSADRLGAGVTRRLRPVYQQRVFHYRKLLGRRPIPVPQISA